MCWLLAFGQEEAEGFLIPLRVAKRVQYAAASPDRSAVGPADRAWKQAQLPPSSIFVERLFKAVLGSEVGAQWSVLQ